MFSLGRNLACTRRWVGGASHKSFIRCSSDLSHVHPERKSDIIVPLEGGKRSHKLEENKNNEMKALQATKVGGLVNVGLAVSKGIVGFGVGSAGLIADAVNSAGDIITDSIVYVTVQLSRSGVTEKRPWGQGKLEPLGTLCVGAILVMTGVGLGHNSLTAAIDIAEAARGVAAVSGEVVEGAAPAGVAWTVLGLECTPWNLSALGVSLGAMVAKEWLFRYTLRAGEAARSSVVITNAWQHRADVGVSLAVFTGVLGGMAGYPLLDPLAGLMVSGMITRQGILAVVEAVQELTDISATSEELAALSATCSAIAGVKQVVSLTARKSGPYLFVEVTIGVAGMMSASAAHRLAELARAQVLAEHEGRVVECLVHVDPLGAAGLGDKAPVSFRDFDSISAEIHRALLTPSPALEASAAAAVADGDDSWGEQEGGAMASLVALGERALGVRCCSPVEERAGADVVGPLHMAFLRRHMAFYVTGISEIQLYYLDSGFIGLKLDVYMNPRVSIREAHTLAVATRKFIKDTLPGVAEVDVDLELDSVLPVGRPHSAHGALGLAAAGAVERGAPDPAAASTVGIKKKWTPDSTLHSL